MAPYLLFVNMVPFSTLQRLKWSHHVMGWSACHVMVCKLHLAQLRAVSGGRDSLAAGNLEDTEGGGRESRRV